LRIKTHSGLRKFILTECCLEKIVLLQGTFSGVMTGYVDIQVSSKSPSEKFSLFAGNQMRTIETSSVLSDQNLVFSTASGRDTDILNKIEKLKCRYLDSSVFALGIVTGDNKRFVSSEYKPGMEKIYTGKEVTPYVMKEPKKYLHYLPLQFQQTAKNECYFAEEKLIYKFISGYPVFAYDAEKTLVLNSANILIPKVPGMCIKTVLGFLNSRVLRYFYMVKFQDIKVLKSNLLQLPIPETEQELSQKIRQLTERIIAGDVSAETELQNIIYRCYKITDDDIEYIENYLASHC
jgi:hypothetical protein